jgi:hypothetical protein
VDGDRFKLRYRREGNLKAVVKSHWQGKERKTFFFEKKEAKNFCLFARGSMEARPPSLSAREKLKVFCFFFSKKKVFL